jgi:hypothetical protein
VADDPAGSREERRLSQFIDAHADEDGDPATSEQTYRDRQAGSSASVDSTPPTSSTTPPTTGD